MFNRNRNTKTFFPDAQKGAVLHFINLYDTCFSGEVIKNTPDGFSVEWSGELRDKFFEQAIATLCFENSKHEIVTIYLEYNYYGHSSANIRITNQQLYQERKIEIEYDHITITISKERNVLAKYDQFVAARYIGNNMQWLYQLSCEQRIPAFAKDIITDLKDKVETIIKDSDFYTI